MQESKLAASIGETAAFLATALDKNRVYKEILSFWAEAGLSFHEVIRQVARDYVAAAVKIEKGNKSKAALRIGLHRNSLTRRAGGKGDA